jgi:hypothetical protein
MMGRKLLPLTSGFSHRSHIQVVCILNIVFGMFHLVAATFLFLFIGIAGGFLAVAGQVWWGGAFGAFASVFCLFLALLGLPCVVVGWDLLSGKPWAKPVNLVLAALQLFNFPLGTMLGAYSSWRCRAKPQTPCRRTRGADGSIAPNARDDQSSLRFRPVQSPALTLPKPVIDLFKTCGLP